MARKKKEDSNDKPKVHKDLEGFDIKVNSFGEVISNMDIEKINEFLDDNVEDKKLTKDQIKDKKKGEDDK